MKKCSRCRIVFHDDSRQQCLYCDMTLLTVDQDDSAQLLDEKDFDPNLVDGGGIARGIPVLKEILKEWRIGEHLRVQYMVGTYFKTRTFKFLYSFSRNSFKMGKDFSRMLAQPLNMSSLLTIPWVVIDLIDSFIIRLSYNAYCSKCGWKFKQVHATQIHDPQECEYNQEYSRVVNDIVSGQITKTEGKIKQDAYQKFKSGKRSAYKDLCSRRSSVGWFFDILCVWFSILMLLGAGVALSLPYFMQLVQNIQV